MNIKERLEAVETEITQMVDRFRKEESKNCREPWMKRKRINSRLLEYIKTARSRFFLIRDWGKPYDPYFAGDPICKVAAARFGDWQLEFDPDKREPIDCDAIGQNPHAEDLLDMMLTMIYPWVIMLGIKEWRKNEEHYAKYKPAADKGIGWAELEIASVSSNYLRCVNSYVSDAVNFIKDLNRLQDMIAMLKPLYQRRDQLRQALVVEQLDRAAESMVVSIYRTRRDTSYL